MVPSGPAVCFKTDCWYVLNACVHLHDLRSANAAFGPTLRKRTVDIKPHNHYNSSVGLLPPPSPLMSNHAFHSLSLCVAGMYIARTRGEAGRPLHWAVNTEPSES